MADQLRGKFPKLGALMDAAENDVLAFMTFPRAHWTQAFAGIDGCGKGYVTGRLVKSILKRDFQAYYDLSFWIECSFATE